LSIVARHISGHIRDDHPATSQSITVVDLMSSETSIIWPILTKLNIITTKKN